MIGAEGEVMAVREPEQASGMAARAEAVPPHLWFIVSAVFHYLGPAFAVLLFPAVGVLGVAWFRITSAAVFFGVAFRPIRTLREASPAGRMLILALGLCLAVMNCAFYLALERLPLSLVASMEFVATMAVALAGLRTRRNLAALALTAIGAGVLIDMHWGGDLVGFAWAALNAGLFALYIALAHRVSRRVGGGVQGLGAAMAVAAVTVAPVGLAEAWAALNDPALVLAGIGVGICSSVIPYVCDQLALARLPRASFALMLALLPATAAVIGALVLAQWPSGRDALGILLVMLGVIAHKPEPDAA